jgi:hypothetical protein
MSQRASVRNETRGKIDYQKTAILITFNGVSFRAPASSASI